MKQGFNFLGVCVVLCVSSSQTWAAAFAHDDLTPAGTGAANAVVAGADDISAAIYNPAGLAWQEGVQAMFGSQSNTRNLGADFAGVSHSGEADTLDLSLFAISWLPQGSDWGVSGAIVTPYSLQINWRGQFSEVIGKSDFQLQRYSLDTFYRLNNTLGIAVGLDVYDAAIELQSGGASFSASDWSKVSGHVALRWEFMPFWTLGSTFRQGADVSVSNELGDTFAITLPDEFVVAVAHDLSNDEMRLELNVKRSLWSSIRVLEVTNNGATSQSLAANLQDTTDIALGLTWFWRQNTQLRFGYAYLEGANDLAAYQPAIADLAGHKLSAGFGGVVSGMHLDVGVSGMIYPDVDATGTNAATYSGSFLTWMFTLSKKF